MPAALPTGGEHDLLDDRLLRVRNMDDLTTPVAKLELDVHTIHESCPRNVVPDQYARGGCRQSDPASAAPTAIIIVTEASVLLFGMIKPIFFMLMTGSLRGDASARRIVCSSGIFVLCRQTDRVRHCDNVSLGSDISFCSDRITPREPGPTLCHP